LRILQRTPPVGFFEMTQRCVALLGKRDEPTDAVEEYCRFLAEALRAHGFEMELARVPWAETGWSAALRELRQNAREWRGEWVFLQYTALAWSRRGFPLQVLRVVQWLRNAGARVAIVYHDVEAYVGSRMIDKVRRSAQLRTMRAVLQLCDLAVFTVPLEKISWVSAAPKNAVFIPVGANLTSSAVLRGHSSSFGEVKTIAVFGITGGGAGRSEMEMIVEAVRFAAKQIGPLRLVVLGRNSECADTKLRANLRDVPVAIEVLGVIPAEEVVRALGSADVLLFVRGSISTRRGSAIAGIACGLPVIAFAGPETAAPITDAGVVLVDREKPKQIGEALVRVFTDDEYRVSLCARSRDAQARYFSWEAIAARYAEALKSTTVEGSNSRRVAQKG
jgi:glycosyltransferase involved in cell wall biosynthesis